MTPSAKTFSFENCGSVESRDGNWKSLIGAGTGRKQGVVASGPVQGDILLTFFVEFLLALYFAAFGVWHGVIRRIGYSILSRGNHVTCN